MSGDVGRKTSDNHGRKAVQPILPSPNLHLPQRYRRQAASNQIPSRSTLPHLNRHYSNRSTITRPCQTPLRRLLLACKVHRTPSVIAETGERRGNKTTSPNPPSGTTKPPPTSFHFLRTMDAAVTVAGLTPPTAIIWHRRHRRRAMLGGGVAEGRDTVDG